MDDENKKRIEMASSQGLATGLSVATTMGMIAVAATMPRPVIFAMVVALAAATIFYLGRANRLRKELGERLWWQRAK